MRVSVLIVNWNTRDDLDRCLGSVLGARSSVLGSESRSEDRTPNTEVIVVDNESSDGSAEMVATKYPEVMLIRPGENLGYAEGNNLAAAASSGDFLLFLNPDTVVPEGAIEALCDFLLAHPKAGLVAPRLVSPDGSTQASVRGMPEPMALLGAALRLDRKFPNNPKLSGYRLPDFDYNKTQPAPQPMASAWLLGRAAWEDVGPFDPQFPLFFNDVDWCLRADRKGYEIWYDADVCIVHRGGASTSQVKPAATRESHRALIAFYRKHYAKRLGPIGLALARTLISLTGALRVGWYQLKGQGPRSEG